MPRKALHVRGHPTQRPRTTPPLTRLPTDTPPHSELPCLSIRCIVPSQHCLAMRPRFLGKLAGNHFPSKSRPGVLKFHPPIQRQTCGLGRSGPRRSSRSGGRLAVARLAERSGVSWNIVNSAMLAEGGRVPIDDPHRCLLRSSRYPRVVRPRPSTVGWNLRGFALEFRNLRNCAVDCEEPESGAGGNLLRNPCGIDLVRGPRERLEAPEYGASSARTTQMS